MFYLTYIVLYIQFELNLIENKLKVMHYIELPLGKFQFFEPDKSLPVVFLRGICSVHSKPNAAGGVFPH